MEGSVRRERIWYLWFLRVPKAESSISLHGLARKGLLPPQSSMSFQNVFGKGTAEIHRARRTHQKLYRSQTTLVLDFLDKTRASLRPC